MTGTVSFKDGTPLEGGRIVFESTSGSQGGSAVVESDGTFQLGTEPTEPGLKAGKYAVSVIPPSPERIVDPATGAHSEIKSTTKIAPKYLSGSTSELEVEINPGENELEIKIDKPA
ncbi:MAG TPA: carboxypeptidase-like regulatory domain-containing protein [Planctomycetaceae bacterium]|nr:carboxypeptidase-like regulatory domain-containing protein [Planctomycetaceae bacterium]